MPKRGLDGKGLGGAILGTPRLGQVSLRETTRTLERGADLRDVQELLGHASPEMTALYTRVTPGRLRDAVDRLDFSG